MKKVMFFLLALLFLLPNFTLASSGLMDSPWPVFHGNSKLTGQSPYDTSKVDGTVIWKFKAEGMVETSPVLDKDGNIYFADHKCYLYSIKPDGTLRWKFKAGDPVTSKEWGGEACSQSSPTIASDGTIYFLPMTGYLFAVSEGGKEKWRYPIFTFKNSWPTPTVGPDGTIYVGSEMYPPTESGRKQEKPAYLYAVNPDGTLKWNFTTGGNWVTNTPSIGDDGTVYISTNDIINGTRANVVFALNQNDGSVKWKFAPPNGVLEGSITVDSDGTLYFPAKGQDDPRKANFYALSSDGSLKWQFPVSAGASLTPSISSDGKIYFGDWGGILHAFDRNGKELWQVETPGGKNTFESLSSSPAIGKEGTIYFGTIADAFFAYTPEGKLKWQVEVSGGGVNSSPAIGADGTVYFASIPGELYAIGGKSAKKAQVSTLANLYNNNSKNNNIAEIILGAIALLLIAGAALLFIFKKNRVVVIVLAGLSVILIGFSAYFYFFKDKDNKTRTSTTEETNQNTNSPNSDGNSSSGCPRRVYGAQDSGYYAVYEMNQKDLTTEEYNWAQSNCPETIWPEDTLGGYKGD